MSLYITWYRVYRGFSCFPVCGFWTVLWPVGSMYGISWIFHAFTWQSLVWGIQTGASILWLWRLCHVLICYGEYGTRRASIIEYACGVPHRRQTNGVDCKRLGTMQNFTILLWESLLPTLEKQTILQPGSILLSLPLQASLHLRYWCIVIGIKNRTLPAENGHVYDHAWFDSFFKLLCILCLVYSDW